MSDSAVITTTSSQPAWDPEHVSHSPLSYDKHFMCTIAGYLTLAEIVFGILVWVPIAGTDYFHVPAFGWVMFVAVVYWVLTAFFFIVYLSAAPSRVPQVPWTVVALFFNGSGTLLYLVSAILDATSLRLKIKEQYIYNSWAASTFFAFLVTLCYAAHTYFSFKAWKWREPEDHRS